MFVQLTVTWRLRGGFVAVSSRRYQPKVPGSIMDGNRRPNYDGCLMPPVFLGPGDPYKAHNGLNVTGYFARDGTAFKAGCLPCHCAGGKPEARPAPATQPSPVIPLVCNSLITLSMCACAFLSSAFISQRGFWLQTPSFKMHSLPISRECVSTLFSICRGRLHSHEKGLVSRSARVLQASSPH